MPFRVEPPSPDPAQERTAVLWCNLGSPDEPTAGAVRPYLAEFLGDPRVVELPKLVWAVILRGIILRTRPAKSAEKYASVWLPEGSPLRVWTRKQAVLLGGWLGERGHRVTVCDAMRYGNPSIDMRLDELKAQGVTRVLVLQAYPQYSATTTASVIDAVSAWSTRVRVIPEFRFVNQYHDDPLYIDALAASVTRYWQHHGRPDRLMMSFPRHPGAQCSPGRSVPVAMPRRQPGCLRSRLRLSSSNYVVSFQSRFGRAKWLEPYTEPTLRQLGACGRGARRRDVPRLSGGLPRDARGNRDGRDATPFIESGGRDFHYIPCLNDSHRMDRCARRASPSDTYQAGRRAVTQRRHRAQP